ncbi:Fatty acid export 5-like [Thalictrum thalictroides]|uniref:Fatty acid export 5-like n=1 Tax=Thalictrum thalictroides TaxID=46969 RepID=A0A7J6WGH0_THATH|nr:Fatty acid export 5-like [Thalictrum thalictroides]
MHDFCFTIPYGLVMVIGGVIGFAKKRSTASLAGGFGTGFLLLIAGYVSLKAFKKRKNSSFALILETESSCGLQAFTQHPHGISFNEKDDQIPLITASKFEAKASKMLNGRMEYKLG